MTRERIRAGLLAYAAGDAAGVPWEGRPSEEVDAAAIDDIPRRGDWPPGATSDDTALSLLVADYLAERGAVVDERDFLTRMAAAAPGIRGIGPSTHTAVARFLRDGSTHAESGDTNGAAMRSLPIGWAIPCERLRRTLVVGLSRTTHGAPEAIGAACVAAAMAGAAVEGMAVDSLVDVAGAEIAWVHHELAVGRALLAPALDAVQGRWHPAASGVSLDAADTLAAVVSVVQQTARHSLNTAEALRYAIAMGGDTDTVAAIAGGIIGCRDGAALRIPWLHRVEMPSDHSVDALSAALATLRNSLKSPDADGER